MRPFSPLLVAMTQIFFNCLSEIFKRMALHISVLILGCDVFTPQLLRIAQSALGGLHFYEKRTIALTWNEQDKVSNPSDDTFVLQPCTCCGIPSATVGHGKQTLGEGWLFVPEPLHTSHLNAVLIVCIDYSFWHSFLFSLATCLRIISARQT